MFVDGDDYISPYMAERLIESIGQSEICVCDFFEYFEDTRSFDFHPSISKSCVLSKDQWLDAKLPGLKVIMCNKLFRKKVF